MRGSDPDAALYWFARMLEGGEDPRFLARRITRMAVEDIGLADPQAQALCVDAWETYERLGSPEGELALAQAVIYLALAPKSNAGYVAYKAARKAAAKTGSEPPPKHILNAPTGLMKDQGYGAGYAYDHDAEDGFSGQDYFPRAWRARRSTSRSSAGSSGIWASGWPISRSCAPSGRAVDNTGATAQTPAMFATLLQVALGGAIGSAARYLVGVGVVAALSGTGRFRLA